MWTNHSPLLTQKSLNTYWPFFALLLTALTAIYAELNPLKSWTELNWVDIVGEGAISLLACLWSIVILSSRPAGTVTNLLALGLGCIAAGTWCDWMDEFFILQEQHSFHDLIESCLTPLGMAILSTGIGLWRQEQSRINEVLAKRERLFRDHRAFDQVTQLAGPEYLRRQIHLEHTRSPHQDCALVLLDLSNYPSIAREHGQREAERALQAISHLLLLNLRHSDLLCRYAGGRYVALLPNTDGHRAARIAQHLAQQVNQLSWHSKEGQSLALCARTFSTLLMDDTEAALTYLYQCLHEPSHSFEPCNAT